MEHEGVAGSNLTRNIIGLQHCDTGQVEGAQITRSGGDGGGQIDDAVHQHQGKEADRKTEGMHDKPIFDRLKQPDQDGGKKDHQHIERGAERLETFEEAPADPEGFFADADRSQMLDQPGDQAVGGGGEHGSNKENC